jgi:hypothetical protein
MKITIFRNDGKSVFSGKTPYLAVGGTIQPMLQNV